jgi:hypothetical protein
MKFSYYPCKRAGKGGRNPSNINTIKIGKPSLVRAAFRCVKIGNINGFKLIQRV